MQIDAIDIALTLFLLVLMVPLCICGYFLRQAIWSSRIEIYTYLE